MVRKVFFRNYTGRIFSNIDIFTLKMSLLFFKVSGLAPFTVKISKTLKKNNRILFISTFRCSSASTIYNVTLIIFASILNSYLLYYMNGLDYMFDSEMVHIIEIALGTTSIFVMLLIWSSFTYNRKAIVEIANRIVDIDMVLATHDYHYYRQRQLNLFLIFFINIIMCVTLLITELISYNCEIIRVFIFVFPIFVASLTIIQYASVLLLLKQRFEHLNDAFENILKFDRLKSEIAFISNEPAVEKIVCLRKTHAHLWELCQKIANFYSVPVLFTITLMCGSIIYSAYYLVIPFVLPLRYKTSILTLAATMWFLIQIIPIIIMAATVSATAAEMKKISDVIHKLGNQSHIDHSVRVQLKDFSFEMVKKKVHFTAYHFFSLDCTILQSIFSMTMTYLIILLQLKSRANPALDHVHHHDH